MLGKTGLKNPGKALVPQHSELLKLEIGLLRGVNEALGMNSVVTKEPLVW
jgi:hypothetical protein